jgi:GxxExxY protein
VVDGEGAKAPAYRHPTRFGQSFSLPFYRRRGLQVFAVDSQRDALTERIIGCAIAVHRELGPGLLEAIYEEAMSIELDEQRLRFQRQMAVPAVYKGRSLGEYRLDLLVEDTVIVEVKSVDQMHPVFEAQLLTYLRVTGKKTGLLINFNTRLLKDGIKRLVL